MYETYLNQYHEDDRAQRLLNVFNLKEGQINVSFVNSPEHVVAWHAHEIQTDYWVCLKGAFKVGLAIPQKNEDGTVEGYEVKWEYLSDKTQKSLKIPPGVYHGYKALIPGSILMYYLTEKFNPNDEFRAKPGAFGENWETESK